MTLDRSPESLFKTSNLYVSIKKLTMLLVNPWWGHFCPHNSVWSTFKYGPLGDIRDLDLVVSKQEILYVSIYKSMLTV